MSGEASLPEKNTVHAKKCSCAQKSRFVQWTMGYSDDTFADVAELFEQVCSITENENHAQEALQLLRRAKAFESFEDLINSNFATNSRELDAVVGEMIALWRQDALKLVQKMFKESMTDTQYE